MSRSAIRTLDRVAEETDTDAYRDLLHEIDRAFDGFERSAVRHGWLADHEVHGDAPDPAEANAAQRCNDSARGRIDLPAFVAATIAQETGHRVGNRAALRLPTDWRAGLDGLPGFDGDAGVLRVTDDRSLLRDQHGRSLAYLGRAHPVVRRACARAQQTGELPSDTRVSVARADGNTPPSVLFTYGAELRSGLRIEMQWVIAVMLSQDGVTKEITTSDQWLRLAGIECNGRPPQDAWQRLFASWVPAHSTDVAAIANAAIHRMATAFWCEQKPRIEREDADLQDWLRSRCKDICGPLCHARAICLVPTHPARIGNSWPRRSIGLRALAATPTTCRTAAVMRAAWSNCFSSALRNTPPVARCSHLPYGRSACLCLCRRRLHDA